MQLFDCLLCAAVY
uniref:Uncharacterized protein n=1 Tax=Arundo donax TaxID=35708 RepID=A0A0A8ZUI3_ARUDO